MQFILKVAVLFIFSVLMFGSSHGRADVVATLSQGAAKLWGGKSCGSIDKKKSSKAAQYAKNCFLSKNHLKLPAYDIEAIAKHSQVAAEDSFFQSLALQQSKELLCADEFGAQLLNSQEAQDNIRQRILQLRETKQRLAKASPAIAPHPNIKQTTPF